MAIGRKTGGRQKGEKRGGYEPSDPTAHEYAARWVQRGGRWRVLPTSSCLRRLGQGRMIWSRGMQLWLLVAFIQSSPRRKS
jgi:hypothetical protein